VAHPGGPSCAAVIGRPPPHRPCTRVDRRAAGSATTHARPTGRGAARRRDPRVTFGAVTTEIEIGRGKRGRRAYSFDDIAVVPSRRTRDPEEVSVAWQIDAYLAEVPVLAAPMDSVMSPATAVALGRLGGIGVLDLEGLWARYDDPEPLLAEVAELPAGSATARMQEIYAAPLRPELIATRLQEVRAGGVPVAGALSPQRTRQHWRTVVEAGVDLFVIRGTTVSAEHVSGRAEPLNLKRFIYELDVPVIVGGAATYQAALHLMRTGAAGVLVGFGGGAAHTNRVSLGIHAPMASAVADVAAARRDYLDESGGRYVHVIADGGVGRSGDLVKAIACGADAVMLGAALARASEAPGRGWHWGSEAHHPELPRGERVAVGTVGTLQEILFGPGRSADGTLNLIGALRRAMATTGYSDVKEFQRVEVVISPYSPR
jgi:IMP dehydrogenase